LAIPKRKEKSKEVCIFATINLSRNGFTFSTADFSGGLAEGIRRGFLFPAVHLLAIVGKLLIR